MKEKYKNRIVGSGVMNPADIKMNPLNWRKHPKEQSKALDDALSRLGWIQDVIVNKTTGHLIDGHLRVETALKNKEEQVPVKYVELTEEEEKIALATFDPLTMMAEQDDAMLKKLLEDCDTDVDMSQYHEDYDKLMRVEHTEEELEAVPDVPKVAKTKRGDVYKLGEHVLMCGDSTSEADVSALISIGGGSEKVDICFSSPPYNAGFGKEIAVKTGRSKYLNDNDNKPQSQYAEFLNKYIDLAKANSKYTFVNIQYLANNKTALLEMINHNSQNLAEIIIWDKTRSQPAISNNVLNSEFEFVFVFSQESKRVIGTIPFRGTLKNIVHIPPKTNEVSDIHNAVFPVEFAKYFVGNFAESTVLDLFGGSGTTLIACEELNRKCRMMELEPLYCDVIVERWEKLTGKHAELIREGGKDAN